MKINSKILLVTSIIFLLTLIISVFASGTFLLSNYSDLQKDKAIDETDHVKSVIDNKLSKIDSITQEYASWDQSYKLMQDYPDMSNNYIITFYNERILKNANINMIFYVDNTGTIIYKKAIDLKTGDDISVPSYLSSRFKNDMSILASSIDHKKSGIISTKNGPMYISSHPILTSQGKGPIMGTFISVRYLNNNFLNSIENDEQISLDIQNINSNMPQDYQKVLDVKDDQYSTQILDDNKIAGYFTLDNIYNQPVLMAKASMSRDIYNQGYNTVLYFILTLIFAGVMVGGATNLLFKKTLSSKLIEIEDFVSNVRKSANFSKRLNPAGSDEFIRLGNGINSMLNTLEVKHETLKNKEREKEIILESLNEALIYLSPELKVYWINNKATEYFKKDHDDIIGSHYKRLWNNINLSNNSPVMETLYTGKTESSEFTLPDGEIWSITASSVIDENNQRLGLVVTILDITEIKKSEEKMRQAKLLAEEANKTKDEFLANMSHELRTPMTSIIGFTDLLAKEKFGELNDNQRKFLNSVSSNSKHLLNLINSILDISKIEAGKMDINYSKFPVKNKINEIKNMIYPLSSKKNIDVSFHVDESISYINTDTTKFVQIMYNLLSNAVKFTPDGGSVSVNVSPVGNMLKVSVNDEGIGIPEDKQDKIFQPFYQVDSSSTRSYQGTGLGLSLIKEYVELLGGDVWLESEPGKGSRFTYTVPININEPEVSLSEKVKE